MTEKQSNDLLNQNIVN